MKKQPENDPNVDPKTIRTWRIERGWSQRELGERLARTQRRPNPYTQTYISQVESGYYEIDSSLLLDTFGLSEGKVSSTDLTNDQWNKVLQFNKWKANLHLDPNFPFLDPINFDDPNYKNFIHWRKSHQETVSDIADSSTAPLTLVSFQPGGGSTTIAKHNTAELNKNLFRYRVVPVYIPPFPADTNAVEIADTTTDAIEESIFNLYNRTPSILRNEQWAQILFKNLLHQPERDFFKRFSLALDVREARCKEKLPPELAKPLNELMQPFINIGTVFSLHYDVSSPDQSESSTLPTESYAQARKMIAAKTNYPAISQMYFGPLQTIDSLVQQIAIEEPESIKFAGRMQFPHYSDTDLAEMLKRRYPSINPKQEPLLLLDVLQRIGGRDTPIKARLAAYNEYLKFRTSH
jgi:transcriptional regulator with XRE-family HTH domain